MAFSNQCRTDYYNPRIEVYSHYQCLEESARNPASLRPLKPEPPKQTISDLNPNWTESQVRIYLALKRKNFNGFSFKGDGSKNIIITNLQGGSRRIAISYRGDGTFQQTSVFDRYGKLVSERIDSDMDGHVDQVYECKEQTCERQYQVVNGKPQRLVRTIASGPDEIIEMYEDKNGKLELIKRSKRPLHRTEFSRDLNGNTATEGDFCFDCYEEKRSLAIEIIESLMPEHNKHLARNRLPKTGSFYESRGGVLIHEECFEQYGDQVEAWVTDAVLEGLSCQVNSEARYARDKGGRGQSYYSHLPRLLNLFTEKPSNAAFSEGALLQMNDKVEVLRNPCQDYKSLPLNLESKIHANNCSFDGRFSLTQPKIICQVDKFELAVSEYNGSANYANASVVAYATNPNYPQPAFVNWKGKTEIYNHPVISFIPKKGKKMTEGQFKATFWHELLHNCGYSHSDEGHPDYAYFCAATCFGKAYNMPDRTMVEARRQCESATMSENSVQNMRAIQRRITEQHR